LPEGHNPIFEDSQQPVLLPFFQDHGLGSWGSELWFNLKLNSKLGNKILIFAKK
jgi:hypothetical protein